MLKMRILLIEDDAMIATAVGQELAREDYAVGWAPNTQEAV
jgi:DNA-binding response OmpR family regulator